MNAEQAMAALQAAPKFGNQVELLNLVERELDGMRAALRELVYPFHGRLYVLGQPHDTDVTDLVGPYLETVK